MTLFFCSWADLSRNKLALYNKGLGGEVDGHKLAGIYEKSSLAFIYTNSTTGDEGFLKEFDTEAEDDFDTVYDNSAGSRTTACSCCGHLFTLSTVQQHETVCSSRRKVRAHAIV